MCSLCTVLGADHWAEQGGSRRGRVFRAALLDRVLGHFGLSLDEWAGSAYVLRDRKGRTAIVRDLGAVWVEAERLRGAALDPLDRDLLSALGR